MVGQAEVQQGTRASGSQGCRAGAGCPPAPPPSFASRCGPTLGTLSVGQESVNCGLQRVKEMIFRSHILGFEKLEDNLKTIGCFEKTKNEVLLLRA